MKTFSKSNSKSRLILMVVYESKKGYWKAFCAPYAVTTQAETSDEAKKKLEELVSLYEEGLKEHAYPHHLVFKELSDPEDKMVLDKVWKEVQQRLNKRTEKSDFMKYSQQQKKEELSIDDTKVFYYEPQLA